MTETPGSLWVVRMVEERFHRDDEGRPLREGRMPETFRRPDEIEYRACPYAGSRGAAGLPMNVSALRQTSAHWDEIIGALCVLRAGYAEARGSWGPDVMDLWRVSQLGSALPWYFALRGEPMPAYAAALSKATLGTGILAQRLLYDMMTGRPLPSALTTADIVALAESTGTLVGETEVCAAPEKMIARFVDAMVTAADATSAAAPASPIAVDRLLAARDRVISFGASYAAFKLALWLYFQARRFLYADICAAYAAAARDAPAVRALLDAPCEPPDFFIIEPGNLAGVPPALRAAWIGQLAQLIAPFAPDGSDRPIAEVAQRMAAAMAADTTSAANAADPAARAVATFAALDALFGELCAAVEAGLRGAPPPAAFDAAARDQLITSPRAVFGSLGAIVPPWT